MNMKAYIALSIAYCISFFCCNTLSAGDIYFKEEFTDSNLASRGWYDGTAGHKVVFDSQRQSNVLELLYPTTGGQTGLGALRHGTPATDKIHIRFFVKYSDNWTWTGQAYGPHEIYILTNKQSAYSAPAWTNMTAYIEVNNGRPHLIIQDGMNIDSSRINQDLTQITENRAVAGGNGCSPGGYDYCSAYSSGGRWYNGKGWKAPTALIQNGKWYLVEARVQDEQYREREGCC